MGGVTALRTVATKLPGESAFYSGAWELRGQSHELSGGRNLLGRGDQQCQGPEVLHRDTRRPTEGGGERQQAGQEIAQQPGCIRAPALSAEGGKPGGDVVQRSDVICLCF